MVTVISHNGIDIISILAFWMIFILFVEIDTMHYVSCQYQIEVQSREVVLGFLWVGVCGRIFGKPTLSYGRIREKDTLCYGPRPPYTPCSTDLGT